MRITYDPAKRNRTLVERGLDFDDVAQMFASRHLTVVDDRVDYGEPRFITIGHIASRMVVTVWTPRKDSRRVVSLRKANVQEQKIYTPQLA